MRIFLFIKAKEKKNFKKKLLPREKELENCDKSLWGPECWHNDKRLKGREQWEISPEPEANHLASEQKGEEPIFYKGKKAQGADAQVRSFIQEQKVKAN